jgi:hypothetical protein
MIRAFFIAFTLLANLPAAAQMANGNITRNITYKWVTSPDEAQRVGVEMAKQQFVKATGKPATKLDVCEQVDNKTVLLVAHSGGPGSFATIMHMHGKSFQVSSSGNGNAKFKDGCRPLDQAALDHILRAKDK